MRKNKEKQPIKQKLAKTLDIPEDMLCDVPRLILTDNSQLQVENHKGILSYEENEITIASNKYKIKIAGNDLKITVITDEYIVVGGKILSVAFE